MILALRAATDGIMNQDETGIDCGGATCPACPPVCGDGVVDPGETCDDGNTLSCDGCSSTCQTETITGTCDEVVILQNREQRYVTLDGMDMLTWAGASQDISSAEVFIREWSFCDAFTLKSTTTGNFAEPQGGLLAATGTNGTVFSPEVCGTDPADYSALRADLDGDGDAFNDAFNYWKSDPTLSLVGGCPPADTASWEKFQIVVTSATSACDVPSASPSLSLLPSESLSPSSEPSSVPSVRFEPSSSPSNVPSLSSSPSNVPSLSSPPSKSLSPSGGPSMVRSEPPSISEQPSPMPSEQPSMAPRPGKIGLRKNSVTVSESAGQVLIDLVRTEGSDGPAVLRYQTASGSGPDAATAGEDYVAEPYGAVPFADGQETGQIVVTLIDNTDIESVEKFSVSLFGVDGAQLGFPRTVQIIIVDDDDGPDLVGYWKFDEESGTAANDSSDNANTGIHNNFDPGYGISTDRVTFESSNNLRSLQFDGVDDFVFVNNATGLDLSAGPYTQSVWIKPAETGTGWYQGIVGFDDGTGAAQEYPGIYVYEKSIIRAGFGDGQNYNSVNTDAVLTVDEWNHVAVTFDGESLIVYVNGEVVLLNTGFVGRTPVARSEYDLSIGYVGGLDFEGSIDELRIYNRALAANEVANELVDGAITLNLLTGKFVTETVLSGGFDLPIGFVSLSDGRMLVSEKIGRIQLYDPGSETQSIFLDITDIVNETNDRGMLGFVLHPDYDNNRYFYVAYTYDPPEVQGEPGCGGPNGCGGRVSRISRFTANPEGTFVDRASEFVLIGNNSTYANIGTPDRKPGLNDPHSCGELGSPIQDCIPADEDSHTIGDLEFGADGMLYCSTGDGGSYGRMDEVNWRSQELDSLSGNILRIDPLTGQGLSDNPFYDGDPDSNRSKVWMLGLRNPYRFSIHPTTGGIFIGEVGWGGWEELNYGVAGSNFGWPAYEGGSGGNIVQGAYVNIPRVQDWIETNPMVTAPLYAQSHAAGAIAIILGEFIKESAVYPVEMAGKLLFTDINTHVIRALSFDPDSGAVISNEWVSDDIGMALVDFWQGSDGYMYCADLFGGTIQRLVWDQPLDMPDEGSSPPSESLSTSTYPSSVPSASLHPSSSPSKSLSPSSGSSASAVPSRVRLSSPARACIRRRLRLIRCHSRSRSLQARSSCRVAILVLCRQRASSGSSEQPSASLYPSSSPSNTPSFEGSQPPSKSVSPSSGSSASAVPSVGFV